MTREERAEMLALMQEVVKPIIDTQNVMQGEMAVIKNGQEQMQDEIIGMKAGQERLQIDVSKINTKIDNDIDRSIKVTMEGHAVINRKLDELIGLDSRVETLEDKVSAIEYVVGKAK